MILRFTGTSSPSTSFSTVISWLPRFRTHIYMCLQRAPLWIWSQYNLSTERHIPHVARPFCRLVFGSSLLRTRWENELEKRPRRSVCLKSHLESAEISGYRRAGRKKNGVEAGPHWSCQRDHWPVVWMWFLRYEWVPRLHPHLACFITTNKTHRCHPFTVIDYAVNFTFPWSMCHLISLPNYLLPVLPVLMSSSLANGGFDVNIRAVSLAGRLMIHIFQVYDIPDALNPEAPSDPGVFLNSKSRNLD